MISLTRTFSCACICSGIKNPFGAESRKIVWRDKVCENSSFSRIALRIESLLNWALSM